MGGVAAHSRSERCVFRVPVPALIRLILSSPATRWSGGALQLLARCTPRPWRSKGPPPRGPFPPPPGATLHTAFPGLYPLRTASIRISKVILGQIWASGTPSGLPFEEYISIFLYILKMKHELVIFCGMFSSLPTPPPGTALCAFLIFSGAPTNLRPRTPNPSGVYMYLQKFTLFWTPSRVERGPEKSPKVSKSLQKSPKVKKSQKKSPKVKKSLHATHFTPNL